MDETTLSAEQIKEEPARGLESPAESERLDETEVQELFDAALLGKPISPPPEKTPESDTVSETISTEVLDKPSLPEAESPNPSTDSPATVSRRETPTGSVGSFQAWFYDLPGFSSRAGLVLLPALATILLIRFHTRDPETLLAKAAVLHSAGKYHEARALYDWVLNKPGSGSSALLAAKTAYLRGGVLEQLWKEKTDGGHDENLLQEMLASYDMAIERDPTPHQIYGAAALLAKAEILIHEAKQRVPPDPFLAQEGWVHLATLIKDPKYEDSPVVRLGIPHRLLAEESASEDPEAAVQLLLQARSLRGSFQDGFEDFSIAMIYKDFLHDEEQAVAHLKKVLINPLASPEIRNRAKRALKQDGS